LHRPTVIFKMSSQLRRKKKVKKSSFGIYANEHVNVGFQVEEVASPIVDQPKQPKSREKFAPRPKSTPKRLKPKFAPAPVPAPAPEEDIWRETAILPSPPPPVAVPSPKSPDDMNEDVEPQKISLGDKRVAPNVRLSSQKSSVQKHSRPLSGRLARKPEPELGNWNTDSSHVNRDLLTIEQDAVFNNRYKNGNGKGNGKNKNTGKATTDRTVDTRRRPQSANNKRSTKKINVTNIHVAQWNSTGELDESRQSGPRMRDTPKINVEAAKVSADYQHAHWKPVNQQWFSTKTALSQLWPRPSSQG